MGWMYGWMDEFFYLTGIDCLSFEFRGVIYELID